VKRREEERRGEKGRVEERREQKCTCADVQIST